MSSDDLHRRPGPDGEIAWTMLSASSRDALDDLLRRTAPDRSHSYAASRVLGQMFERFFAGPPAHPLAGTRARILGIQL